MNSLTLFTSFVSDFEYNSKMTHTYSLNFEKSIVSASSAVWVGWVGGGGLTNYFVTPNLS